MSQLATSHARIQARHAGFFKDVVSIAIRALRSVPRDPEAVYPALVIPIFFFAINVGALQDIAERIPGIDYKAFQLPVAILFAVTGVSRAVTLVTDIQTGYFDRLSMTPVNRFALLLGLTVADFSLVVALTIQSSSSDSWSESPSPPAPWDCCSSYCCPACGASFTPDSPTQLR